MRGTMMDFPLTLSTILERSGKIFHRVEIVSRKPDKSIARTTYGHFYRRARRLAAALTKLGLRSGDRVASMMWNHSGHLEAFFGVPCAGGILHTLNLRLHPHEIAAIAKHAGGRLLLIDDVLLPVYEKFREDVSFERVIVVPYGFNSVPEGFLNYEELLASASAEFRYPAIDENDGAAMCFTSGTTGFSKGVIYSHRALVLHSFACGLGEVFGMSQFDTVLPVAPMFHANAWGIPFAATMLGARLVLPGPHVDPESILSLIVSERVTIACGVPTVWIAALEALEKNPGRWKFDAPIRVVCGGTAPPLELIRRLDRFGLQIKHLWGMTETTPVGTSGGLRPHMRDWPESKKLEARAKQGWPAPFVEIRLMRPEGPEGRSSSESTSSPEGTSNEVPWDGVSTGEIEIRGPWIAASYYESPDQAHRWTDDGWFRTGDVATMDEDGYVKIVDRAKDLVKSGGEWISSVDLENALMGHPAVKEACVVGIPHPKWQERPLAAIVLKDGAHATPAELRAFLAETFAKWQLPDAFVFLDAIPRTSVGKFKKITLREQFANWNWEQ
jgi:fatty-acyl-CoA synthase